MILVDVYIPSLDVILDLKLEENTPVSQIKAEIVEMFYKREKVIRTGGAENFLLCSKENEMVLPAEKTLAQCGIRNGNRLILV